MNHIPKELGEMLKANDSVTKCVKKPICNTKSYKQAKKELNETYKAKHQTLLDAMIKKEITGDQYVKQSYDLNKQKQSDIERSDILRKFYECALQVCGDDIETLKKTVIAFLHFSINESKEFIKKNKNDAAKKMLVDYHKKDIIKNQEHLKILKKATTAKQAIQMTLFS